MNSGYINIQVALPVYNKDPQTSDLGRKILISGLELIDEVGLEDFTFRKLAIRIQSTEASIYRYFENKQAMLHYYVLWYWGWLKHRVTMISDLISDPRECLLCVVDVLTTQQPIKGTDLQFNERQLYRVIMAESQKIFLNKRVDEVNKEGFFRPYKELVNSVSDLICEVNPTYPYSKMLASSMIEGAHLQHFFAEHLPGLTNVDKKTDSVKDFYRNIFKELLF